MSLLVLTSGSEMVGELVVGVGHAGRVLGLVLQVLRGVGDCIEGHRLVLGVLNLIQVDVRDLFVLNNSGIVRRRIAWQLGEV